MSQGEGRGSVFAPVNQDEMAAKIEQNTSDDPNSSFLEESLRTDSQRASAIFDSGVRALSGLSAEVLKSIAVTEAAGQGSFPVTPPSQVRFTEPVPQTKAARSAFILYGPSGVCR